MNDLLENLLLRIGSSVKSQSRMYEDMVGYDTILYFCSKSIFVILTSTLADITFNRLVYSLLYGTLPLFGNMSTNSKQAPYFKKQSTSFQEIKLREDVF